jgi:osmoprotectant transport system permease protein
MAGLRIAMVSTISIATVAAFIIPDGLGLPIFIALQQDVFKTEILAAGLLAIGLALFADALIVLAQRWLTPWTRAA